MAACMRLSRSALIISLAVGVDVMGRCMRVRVIGRRRVRERVCDKAQGNRRDNGATGHFSRKLPTKMATSFVRRFRGQWCDYAPLGVSKRLIFLSKIFRLVAKFTTRTTTTPRTPNNTLVYKLALPVVGRVYGMKQRVQKGIRGK